MSSFIKPNLFNNYIKFLLQKKEQDKVILLKREKRRLKERRSREQKIREEEQRRQEQRRQEQRIQERRRREQERRRQEERLFQLSFNYIDIMNDNNISNITPILDDYTSNQQILSIKDFNKLNKCKYNNNYNNNCTICLDEFKLEQSIIRFPCKHNYHINCIKEWLCNNSNKCPLCKIPVIS